MKDPRVQLKNPIVAAVLAYLIPGAGHWYQGRRFKATIYSGCILTIFVWGMILGNWQPVYSQLVQRTRAESAQFEENIPPMKFAFGYGAQFLVGLPAIPALVQEMRFRGEDADIEFLGKDMVSDFTGILREQGDREFSAQPVSGQISVSPLNPDGSEEIEGTLKVVASDGSATEYELGGSIDLGRAVFGSPRREFRCRVISKDGVEYSSTTTLQGTVSRSFLNWFQAPRDSQELDRLHGELSRKFDIACVFTWIAGLLNLLAIWDAAAGPAYGYGDETSKPDEEQEQ